VVAERYGGPALRPGQPRPPALFGRQEAARLWPVLPCATPKTVTPDRGGSCYGRRAPVASCSTKPLTSSRCSFVSEGHARLIRRSKSSWAVTVDGGGRPSSRWIAGTRRLCLVTGRKSTVRAAWLTPMRRDISAREIPAFDISSRTPRFHSSSTGHIAPEGLRCRAISRRDCNTWHLRRT